MEFRELRMKEEIIERAECLGVSECDGRVTNNERNRCI